MISRRLWERQEAINPKIVTKCRWGLKGGLTMKRVLVLMVILLTSVLLAACGKSSMLGGHQMSPTVSIDNKQQTIETSKLASNSAVAQQGSETSNTTEKMTNITLTIGNTVIPAYLNNTAAAKDLIAHLPVKVKLFDSDNDYCGDIVPPLAFKKEEVQYGYKNGDLAFWTAGNDFVIFIDGEERSANTGNLVIIGKVTKDLEKIRTLGKSIDVTIALAE